MGNLTLNVGNGEYFRLVLCIIEPYIGPGGALGYWKLMEQLMSIICIMGNDTIAAL